MGVKFIRKNGRVIPIRDNGGGQDSHGSAGTQHLRQVKLGAAAGVGAHLTSQLLSSPLALKSKFGQAALIGTAFGTAGISVKGLYHQVSDAIHHGQKQHSALSGVGRFLTLSLANTGGQIAGGAGTHLALKGAAAGARAAARAVKNTHTIRPLK